MATSVDSVRSALAGMGDRGRTTRIPDEIRSRVMRYAREQRRGGRSWRDIAAEVGVSSSGLQRWASARPRKRRTRPMPVRVREAVAAGRSVAVVVPSGVRIEGLSLDDAVSVLQRLG